jgi:fatty-acyl-CoA synthase
MYPINFLRRAAERFSDSVAAVDGSSSCTYRELMGRSDALAAAFQKISGKDRPTVAILGPNCLDMLVALMAVHACGAILVPLNGRNATPELTAQINRVAPDLFVVHRQYLGKIESGDVPIVVAEGEMSSPLSMVALTKQYETCRAEWSADVSELNGIKFTGGSSGVPKGVMQSFRCLNTMISSILIAFELTEQDRYLCAAPMTHGAGSFLIPVLSRGGCVVMTSDAKASNMLDLIQAEHITATWVPPTMLYSLIDEQKRAPRKVESLRHLIWGGAPASLPRLQEAQRVFGPVVETIFGQTEAPLLLASARANEVLVESRLTSVGRINPLVDVGIFDTKGKRLRAGELGEVCARGDLLMLGYLDMPDETAKTFRDGWLRTGDIGLIDEDGFLYLKDRLRDVVISGGFNVYPSDVEAAIAAHPSVSEVVVFGIPDDYWGERVEASLECRPGHSIDPAELIDFCKSLIGSVKTPKTVHIVSSLPRSPVGKVLRREARASVMANQGTKSS